MASPDNSVTNGFVGVFRTPDEGGSVRVRLGTTAKPLSPVVEVSEEAIESGGSIVAIAKLDISEINIQEGTIMSVLVERSIDNTNWIPLPPIALSSPITGVEQAVTVRVSGVPWARRGVTNYFKVYLLNADGEVAWQHFGEGAGTPPLITDSASFNGTTDLNEYPEVTGLTVVNVGEGDGGSFESPVALPANGVARLKWDDMRVGHANGHVDLFVPVYAATAGPPARAAGDRVSTEVSNAKLQQIEGYVVYMFVCATAAPAKFCPNGDADEAAKGTWYRVMETTTNFADVTLPRNKSVCFWVGCKMQTVTQALVTAVNFVQD